MDMHFDFEELCATPIDLRKQVEEILEQARFRYVKAKTLEQKERIKKTIENLEKML